MSIIPAREAVRSLDELEPLARRIFGGEPRPEGWFRRKLKREAVSRDLSKVFLDPRGEPAGYVLAGTPSAMPDTVRTAGVGVLQAYRSEGNGAALLGAVVESAMLDGFKRLRSLAEPSKESFYTAMWYRPVRRLATRHRRATGEHNGLVDGTEWSDLDDGASPMREIAAWMPDAWRGTEPQRRFTFTHSKGAAHVSREGDGFLVQRLCVPAESSPDAVTELLDELLAALPGPSPVMLYGTPQEGPVAEVLERKEWRTVQPFAVMERAI